MSSIPTALRTCAVLGLAAALSAGVTACGSCQLRRGCHHVGGDHHRR